MSKDARQPGYFIVKELTPKWASLRTHEIKAYDALHNLVIVVEMHHSYVALEKKVFENRGFVEKK